MAPRTMLLTGCCAVSDRPEVWLVIASRQRAGVFCAELVAHHFGIEPSRGADFGDLFEEIHAAIDQHGNSRRE